MWILALAISAVTVTIVAYVWSRGRYYRRMFAEENLRAFYDGMVRALEVARRKGADAHPSLEDGSAFLTGAGLGVGVTRTGDGVRPCEVHISLSQPGTVTTHSVCSRFGFLASVMLGENQPQMFPFFTDSHIHHLVFRFEDPHLGIRGFPAVLSSYSTGYEPISFEHERIESRTSDSEGEGR